MTLCTWDRDSNRCSQMQSSCTGSEPLHDAVPLRRVGRDELLGQPVASDGFRVALAGEGQAVVASQDDRLRGSPEVPEAVDQRFFQSSFSCFGAARGGEAPTQKFPASAVNHKPQVTPTGSSAPGPGQIGGPTGYLVPMLPESPLLLARRLPV